jgi:hypothetical protein
MSFAVSGYAAFTKSFTFGTNAAVRRVHHDHVIAAGQHLEELEPAGGVFGEESLGRVHGRNDSAGLSFDGRQQFLLKLGASSSRTLRSSSSCKRTLSLVSSVSVEDRS